MREQFFKTLERMFAEDDKIILVLGDLGVYTARNLFRDYPTRVFNIGICEQSSISFCAGLAIEGFKPIFYSIAPFAVERCLEQIKLDIGYQNLNVSIVSAGASYDYAALGCSHHCPADVEVMLSIPNMTVLIPGSLKDVDSTFSELHGTRPLYMRLSETHHEDDIFNGEVAEVNGKNNIIIAVGTMLSVALSVSRVVNADVLYCNQLPFSWFFSNEKVAVLEPFYDYTMARFVHGKEVLHIGVPRKFITSYGTKEEHDFDCGLDLFNVREKLIEFFND